MGIDSLTDDDYDAIASQVAQRLDTGLYGNRAVLSRRQLLSLAGGSAGVAGLTALGVDPATAQSAAGQVGTASSPEDVFAFDLDVQGGAEFNGNGLSGVGTLSTHDLDIGEQDFIASGDRFAALVLGADNQTPQTTSSSYESKAITASFSWDNAFPADATVSVTLSFTFSDNGGDQLDARLYNSTDGETVVGATDITGAGEITTTYAPADKSTRKVYNFQIRNSDNATTVDIDNPTIIMSVDTS